MLATRSQLTQREREVLCLLATGYTDRKIAAVLTISPRTVNRHMGNIFSKGEAFLSNAVVDGTFLLRACIVNFRTALEDIEALPGIVIRVGREVDATIRPGALKQEERNILSITLREVGTLPWYGRE